MHFSVMDVVVADSLRNCNQFAKTIGPCWATHRSASVTVEKKAWYLFAFNWAYPKKKKAAIKCACAEAKKMRYYVPTRRRVTSFLQRPTMMWCAGLCGCCVWRATNQCVTTIGRRSAKEGFQRPLTSADNEIRIRMGAWLGHESNYLHLANGHYCAVTVMWVKSEPIRWAECGSELWPTQWGRSWIEVWLNWDSMNVREVEFISDKSWRNEIDGSFMQCGTVIEYLYHGQCVPKKYDAMDDNDWTVLSSWQFSVADVILWHTVFLQLDYVKALQSHCQSSCLLSYWSS